MSLLITTYFCEVGKMYIGKLENQIRNYQINKAINKMKDDFLLNPTCDINKVSMGI